MKSSCSLWKLSLAAVLSVTSALATAGARVGVQASTLEPGDSTDRLIVKLRDPAERDPSARISQLGTRFGERISRLRGMSANAHVVQLSRRMTRGEASAVARRLASDPSVAFVEPDVRMYPQRVPNDSLYAQQWNYFESAGGINLPKAWDITVGAANLTVAVIDTGILNHADLAGRLVPGYDFIGDVPTANDGDGRDPDASDPGDYGCNGGASSWHGTHVAGTIGAASNNGTGVAGVNWASKIQSARALGKCGGYTSDIADAMRWASGIAIPGVPANPTPARVLNLSLGGSGACSATFQNAINDVTARGTVVVVAAGNSNADAANFSPAGCSGVIAVAATTRNGGKASYSNFGSSVAIAAPGGGGNDGILSTLNTGSTVPAADTYAAYQGTSMATPHVAGVVSLMLSANPALTPAQVRSMLQSTARAFPTGTGADCTRTTCGAGIVDAAAALAAAAPAPPPQVTGRVNLALAANGGVMTASSTFGAGYPPSGANDGDRRGRNWAAGGGWADGTFRDWGDWLQLDLGTTRTVSEVDVFTIQDDYANPQEPTEAMTFTQYGVTDFEVQYWTGASWQTVPGGSVSGNNKVWRKFTFAPIAARQLRVLTVNALNGYSRIAEVEAYEVADAPAPAPGLANVALQSNGGTAIASSTLSASYSPAGINDGDRRATNWGNGGGWADGTFRTWPDVAQINFNATKSVSEIDVFGIQDNYTSPADPTLTMTFSQWGITDFDVEYWNGSAWVAVPGGNVNGNDKVWRKFSFAPVSTNSIRVVIRGSLGSYSRIAEIEAYGQ